MMKVIWSYQCLVLFTLWMICIEIAASEATHDTIRCPQQDFILWQNETITIHTYKNETCNFTVSSSNYQGITVNVLHSSSWSIYDYFTLQEAGEDCFNQSYGWIGSSQEPCAIVLNCSTMYINMRASSIVEIQSIWIPPSNRNVLRDPTNLQESHNTLFHLCENIQIFDDIFQIQYYPFPYFQLEEFNPSLKITLTGDPYFRPEELPGFDLGLPDYTLLAEFPPCPIGCFCSLNFQLFLTDCPDIPVNKNTMLLYQPPDIILANSTTLDLSNRRVTQVEPNTFSNLTDVIILLLSRNNISTIEPDIFKGLQNIHTLDLSFNQISSIEAGSFLHLYTLKRLLLNVNKLLYISHSWLDGLVSVQVLYLGGNTINDVESDIYSDMESSQVLSITDSQLSQIENLPSELLLLDLSSNNFSSFPIDLPKNLTHISFDNNQFSLLNQTKFSSTLISLVLSNNDIVSIPNDTFSHLQKLKRLRLNHNIIEIIHIDLLQNLTKLEVLGMSYNRIESLPLGVFQDLHLLQELWLNNNKLKMIHTDLFQDLHLLQELWLNNNKLKMIQTDLFYGLTKLQTLDLGNNNIESLTVGVFRDLQLLQELYLYNNKLKMIQTNLFYGLTKLQLLYMHHNSIESLPSGVFRDLQLLQELHLNNNKLKMIQTDLFCGLTKLQILYLDNNSIESLPSGVFRDLQLLQELFLNSNKLKMIQTNLFYELTKLQTLDLSNNSIESLPSGVFRSLQLLQELALNNNKLKTITLDHFYGLTKLDPSNNSTESLPSGVFRSLKLLQKLWLNNNKLKMIQTNLFNGLTKLQILTLNTNSIESLPSGVFRDLQSLQMLGLENNKLKMIQTDLFNGLTKLQTLGLSNNSIESLPSGVFRDLQLLQDLSLGNNKMKMIQTDLFYGLTKLQVLDLAINSIESLPSGHTSGNLFLNNDVLNTSPPTLFKDLTNLKSLFLHGNRLTEIPEDLFHQSGMSLQLLTLSANKINNIYSYQFANLTNLKVLDLGYNTLNQIHSRSLYGLTKLKYLDLDYNDLTKVTKTSFTGMTLQENSYLIVDNPAICCFLEPSNRSQCVPRNQKSPYLTCKQLLPSTEVKCCTWIFGFSALFANTLVLIWGCQKIIKSKSADEKEVKQIVFITNLALADLLMGIYLLVIASVDQYYNEYFPLHAKLWRKSVLCKVAGFLSVLSSEASLLFLTIISVDRLWAFRKIVITHKLFGKRTQVLLAIFAWVIALASSIVPAILNDDKLYQFSDVCIGLPLVRNKIYKGETESITISYNFDRRDDIVQLQTFTQIGSRRGNYFSIGLFLGLNFLLCLMIAICYILLFMNIWKSGFALLKTDFKMAIKMGALALTDLMCWFPIIILGILAQTGVKELPPEWIPWITAFALPINSVLNPFLYATIDRVSKHYVEPTHPHGYIDMETML
ncbi:uncharacterized protein [Amphiura filiformis]|uniref:uncharacterized protein n=1 Tax=Amphiura filiformis TaxID=82378 RepID=UPI003B2160FF